MPWTPAYVCSLRSLSGTARRWQISEKICWGPPDRILDRHLDVTSSISSPAFLRLLRNFCLQASNTDRQTSHRQTDIIQTHRHHTDITQTHRQTWCYLFHLQPCLPEVVEELLSPGLKHRQTDRHHTDRQTDRQTHVMLPLPSPALPSWGCWGTFVSRPRTQTGITQTDRHHTDITQTDRHHTDRHTDVMLPLPSPALPSWGY